MTKIEIRKLKQEAINQYPDSIFGYLGFDTNDSTVQYLILIDQRRWPYTFLSTDGVLRFFPEYGSINIYSSEE